MHEQDGEADERSAATELIPIVAASRSTAPPSPVKRKPACRMPLHHERAKSTCPFCT